MYLYHKLLIPIYLLHLISTVSSEGLDFGGNNISDVRRRRECSFEEDASDLQATPPQIIQNNGFPTETHNVTTEDGYILEFHRIPARNKPAVVLFHGMFVTSREWFMNCDGRALPFKLAKEGYDVWLVNARGNSYSQRHLVLSPEDPKFWDFSLDEIIKYDVSRTIDYILEVTKVQKLNCISWSLGSTFVFGLLTSQPEYNNKVNVFIGMGSSGYNNHAKSRVGNVLAHYNGIYEAYSKRFTRGKSLPPKLYHFLHNRASRLCIPEARTKQLGFCYNVLSAIVGKNPTQANPVYYPMLFSNIPSVASFRMVNHILQWIKTGERHFYDFGITDNLKRYGTEVPPLYELKMATAPFVNFWAENDYLAAPKDVERTINELPNVVQNYKVNMSSWTHFDFVWGKDADIFVYDLLIKFLRQYTLQ